MPEDEKDRPRTEQTPTGYTVPVSKRDEFSGNPRIAEMQGPAPRPAQSGMRGKGSRRPPPPHSSGRKK
jgi:hypothetical protein